ncbi:hypothetical protein LRS06_11370 [Hymenobacter sp. J193]|uniref:hypothetical protein n=1 Tax=Hymenobacter sp. J193 TaxID=2898429 RepID=UPI002151081E|nr:hypothetical protein [Hymenobacter sp. J193]MCR5888352.1 hypothetical protein [Hymenobacter sp. J193]
MLTGIIISYTDERWQVRTNTGLQYSFTDKQVKSPGSWRPKVKEAVIVKLQDGQSSAVRSVRQLPPGYLKAHHPPRMVPARYVGWGVAVSRFAAGIELSPLLRAQHNVVPGSILLVRYEAVGNIMATAKDVTIIQKGSEQQQALAAALFADEKKVAMEKAALLKLLEELGEVRTDEDYKHLKDLLLHWDALAAEPVPFRVTMQADAGQRLAADGYAHCLNEATLLGMLDQATDLAPLLSALRQLPAATLKHIVMERLALLSAETLLQDYRLISQLLKAAPDLVQAEPMLQPPALGLLPLPETVRVHWWEQGLVPMPAQSVLTAEMSRRLDLALTDSKAQEPLRRLVDACRRDKCLKQVGQEMLLAIPGTARLTALRGLLPMVDEATGEKWVRECLIGHVNDDDLYTAWEQNKLFWLPTELITTQLFNQVSAAVPAVLQRLARLPDAIAALAQAGGQGPWEGERGNAIKEVLQVLHKAASAPAPHYSWELQKPTSGLPAAWAKEALQALQQKVTDLSGATQLEWWLADLLPEPADDILLPYFLGSADPAPVAGWVKLSAAGAAALEGPLLKWVEQTQPIAWIYQAQKAWMVQPHLLALRQRVLALIETSWPAAAQVELWVLGGSAQPSSAILQSVLAEASVDQAREMFTRATTSTLPELFDQYLAGRPTGTSSAMELALEIAKQHAPTEPGMRYRYNRLVNLLVNELEPVQYYDYWQRQLLPPPPVERLCTIVRDVPETDWPLLFQRCPVELLQQYLTTELATADRKDEQAKAMLKALGSRTSYDTSAVNVRDKLLAGLSDEQQLGWWLEGLKEASPSWEVVAQALAAKEQPAWLAIVEKVARERLNELLAYLPAASRMLLGVVAGLLCEQRILRGQYASLRVPSLVKFAEVVTEKLAHEPALILPWLQSILQQCQPPNVGWANSRYSAVEDLGRARIRLLISERVFTHLDEMEQLRWWGAGLVANHPAVEQAVLVEFVGRNMPESFAGRVATAYAIPEAVVRGWQGLGNLRAAHFEQQFPAMKVWLPAAAHHADLLQAVGPYLDAKLTHLQKATLWLYGYPIEPPGEGGRWTIVERMQGVIRLRSLGKNVESTSWLMPTAEEVEEWLSEQYWQEEDQQLAGQMLTLLRDYHALEVVALPAWEELEREFLSRCAGVVKVRLWLTLPPESQQRTFNYYTFRRGYSRLRVAEQREFLRMGLPYLKQAGKTEQDMKGALHLRRRRLVRQQDGVSVYRVCLAHCYCPGEGLLEVELADKAHTRPCAYPGAEDNWNDKFLREPYAGCPVLAHVDDQTLELLRIQGLEAALNQYPTDQQPRDQYVFQRKRKEQGTIDNPASYWEDEGLHDEFSSYLLELTAGTGLNPVILTEKKAPRQRSSVAATISTEDEPAALIKQTANSWAEEELAMGLAYQPQQMELHAKAEEHDMVFIWAARFAHSNRAVYIFRAPLLHQEQALERLTDLLQNVGGIRSALLAPGLVSHRLRCHLGYVRNIRGQRGHTQAFEGWQKRFDAAVAAGPSRQHPYNPDSDFAPWELEVDADAAPVPPAYTSTSVNPTPDDRQATAQRMLRQLQHLNSLFLAGYPS